MMPELKSIPKGVSILEIENTETPEDGLTYDME